MIRPCAQYALVKEIMSSCYISFQLVTQYQVETKLDRWGKIGLNIFVKYALKDRQAFIFSIEMP